MLRRTFNLLTFFFFLKIGTLYAFVVTHNYIHITYMYIYKENSELKK